MIQAPSRSPSGRALRFLLGAILLLPLSIKPASAQDCLEYWDYLHWRSILGTPDYVNGMAVSWPYAYLSIADDEFLVLDFRNPDRPVVAGSTPNVDTAQDLALAGDFCYLIETHPGSGEVVDISDPHRPLLVGPFATGDDPEKIIVVGDYLYLGTWDLQLRIFDVSIPHQPVQVGMVETGISCRDLTANGGYLFVLGHQLGILSLANPTLPTVLCSLELPSNGYAMDIDGNLAYIGMYDLGLQILDIATPCDPVALGFLPFSSSPNQVWAEGDVAYMASRYSDAALISVDITDPQSPAIIQAFEFLTSARRLALGPGILTVADARHIQLIDVHSNHLPAPNVILDTPGLALSVAVSGNLACVADYYTGLQVIDIADPVNPNIVGAVATPGLSWDVTIAGNHAYLADFSGLTVMDISTPGTPVQVGHHPLPPNAHGVAISGDLACVAWGFAEAGGIELVDISNPENPTLLGLLDLPNSGWGLEIVGDHAFVGHGWNGGGLEVFDITDPSLPQVVGSVTGLGTVRDVAVSGDHAYLAADAAGLQVVDISDLADPVLIRTIVTPGNARGVTVDDGIAFLAGELAGIHLFDVTDPLAITSIGMLGTESEAWAVVAAGNHLLVAGHESGLVVAPRPCSPVTATFADPLQGNGPHLEQSFPNPFNPRTSIRFMLPHPALVNLRVYDLAGRLVRTLLDDTLAPQGQTLVSWEGRDDLGHPVAAGVYMCRLQAGTQTDVVRMVLVR